jgi:predicted DNA-binding protein (MmcQ/YjbR family)
MTLETVRSICRAMSAVTEDIKWDADLVFSVGGRMFCVVNTEPPHQVSFKCTPEEFAELIERAGVRPAPYLARAMWVQQTDLRDPAFDRGELQRLLRTAYDLVVAKLPKSMRPGVEPLKRRAKPRR